MSDIPRKDENPTATLATLRERILSGGSLLVEDLTDEELVAMQELLLEGKAEIVSSACRPYLAARLDRTII